MAVWQFVCDLIPSSAATFDGAVAAHMKRDQLDAIELNFSVEITDAIFKRVGTMLPEKQSWTSGLRIWGDEEADDVKIGVSGTTIEDVQFRLNVADLSLSLVTDICALAREFNCVLAARSGAIVPPYDEALLRTITQSSAARFVSDPEQYLCDVDRHAPEPG